LAAILFPIKVTIPQATAVFPLKIQEVKTAVALSALHLYKQIFSLLPNQDVA
jgi:hypothetical protein